MNKKRRTIEKKIEILSKAKKNGEKNNWKNKKIKINEKTKKIK